MSLHRNVETEIFSETYPTRVKNTPPFPEFIHDFDRVGNLSDVINGSHRMDEAYLSWQTIRKNGAQISNGSTPLNLNFRTGFEGYLVGQAQSQEEAFDHLLQLGLRTWNSIRMQHKHSWSVRNNMEKTIMGGKADFASLERWSAIFGAMLARERMVLYRSAEAMQFRNQTREKVLRLPAIQYSRTDTGLLVEEYVLPSEEIMPIEPNNLNDEQTLAWTTMRRVGQLGHPIIRETLRAS